MRIDFHVHTTRGSSDSNLDPLLMIDQAHTIGLEGICITEHDNAWTDPEVEEYARERGVTLFLGIEVTTEWGHVGAFGLDRYVGGIYKVKELRRIIDEVDGFLIANHPFRYKLDPRFQFIHKTTPIDQANPVSGSQALEVLDYVDAIEVVNGACSEEENRYAQAVAEHVGCKRIGGSDSHSASSIGCAVTIFERPLSTTRELIDELKAGRYSTGQGLNTGDLREFP
ncbi:MAG: PHP domain-containing protein [Desulfurellaceae bacterium]|nr:PHP domain-containing protein [Desulfurellaceae bacterium]